MSRFAVILIFIVLSAMLASAGGDTAAQWPGLGTAIRSHSGGGNAWRVTAGDFNGDRMLDLAVGHGNEFTVGVLLGKGDGTFQPPSESAAGDEPLSLALGDFNNDGKPDVAAGSRQSYVSVSLNSIIIPGSCQRFATTTVFTDPTGDASDGDPSHDIQSLSISERPSADGEQVLVFTLKVAGLNTFRDTTSWWVGFDLPYAHYGLQASSSSGRITFPSIANGENNFTADGTINFVVPRKKLDIGPGEELTNIQAAVTFWVGEVFQTLDTAPASFPSPAVYAPGGTTACTTPTPSPTPTPTPSAAPFLHVEEGTSRAIALDSVTLTRDPFTVRTTHNSSPDQRTRIILFASNLELLPGEDASLITAQAKDTQQRVFPLPVEYVGKVRGLDWLTQVVVKLPDELEDAGDVQVSISLRGVASNNALITLKVGDASP